ncbi:hypothetical protein ACERZ8_14350 [Tateyamaria armeniaca]|uniref:VPLPA-CTERM sorting domain-containing protein n=1 Tax=Tateyamaria armeniaca TaxID=2518930 RepID=A0ABW8UYB2_9RHOB
MPYNGSFDEATISPQGGLPGGDFDTLGGLEQVGLFQLGAGANTFTGSVNAPTDTADVFLIEILEGFELVSASLEWATNLLGVPAPSIFNLPPGYLEQNTFAPGTTPIWTVEESDETPTIFLLDGIDAFFTPKSYVAPAFEARGPGIYSSLFDGKTSCAQTYVPANPGVNAQCVEGLDYTMTFNVVQVATPPAVPLPAGAWGLVSGLALLGAAGLHTRRRKSASANAA